MTCLYARGAVSAALTQSILARARRAMSEAAGVVQHTPPPRNVAAEVAATGKGLRIAAPGATCVTCMRVPWRICRMGEEGGVALLAASGCKQPNRSKCLLGLRFSPCAGVFLRIRNAVSLYHDPQTSCITHPIEVQHLNIQTRQPRQVLKTRVVEHRTASHHAYPPPPPKPQRQREGTPPCQWRPCAAAQ